MTRPFRFFWPVKTGFLYIILFFSVPSQAQQQANIRDATHSIKTYPFSDPDPVPRPGRIYPYFRFDGYTNTGRPVDWKVVEIENDFVKMEITPEIGGKIWSAYEKSQNFPFIFSNHVVKFRDVALRGAWTSGGIEFNFGDYGHAPTTSSPVDYFTRKNKDGSVSCFIGATDWSSRTSWRVEINLKPDKAYFTTRSWWYNGTPLEQSYYNWSNAGFRAPGNLEYIYPGTNFIGHQGEHDTYPIDSLGREISFYEKNSFGSYKSYHVLGKPADFYGGFWHDYNMGVGHFAPYHEKLGKKSWSWGLSREGLLWEGLLTDTDGPNVELQSGRLFSQAAPQSMYTPFKHVAFSAYTFDTWQEYWFPVKHTRGMTHATPQGAMNLRMEGEWLKLDWMPLENQTDTLKINYADSTILSRKLSMKPLQLLRDSVKWNGDIDKLTVSVGANNITNEFSAPVQRPLDAPKDFNWNSEYGLLIRGQDLAHQRNYLEAEIYLSKALQINAYMIPALCQMAQIRYRQGEYSKARDFAKRAISVNTYDGEANYMWGLTNEAMNDVANAFDGYSVASLDPAFRPASLIRLSYLAMAKKDWNKAAFFITECLDRNSINADAKYIDAVILRKQGKHAEALSLLQDLLLVDPLNHFARFEVSQITKTENDRKDFVSMIRQELPHETFLELAIRYNQWNMLEEALEILSLSPAHPMVQLWQAYLLNKQGKTVESDKALSQSVMGSAGFVFPFRHETLAALRWAELHNSNWKLKYYQGLICWQNNQFSQAKELFTNCGNPKFPVFHLAKAELFKDEPLVAEAALLRAYQLDSASWRIGLKLAAYYNDENQYAKAIEVTEKNYKAHPASYIIGLQYAQVLIANNEFEKGLVVMDTLLMLPAEHALEAPKLFRQANVFYAIENMKKGKWNAAIDHLQKSKTWPENLGAGEPFNVDNRVPDFLLAYAYDQSGKKNEADKSFLAIKNYRSKDNSHPDSLGEDLANLLKTYQRNYSKITQLLVRNTTSADAAYLKEFIVILKK